MAEGLELLTPCMVVMSSKPTACTSSRKPNSCEERVCRNCLQPHTVGSVIVEPKKPAPTRKTILLLYCMLGRKTSYFVNCLCTIIGLVCLPLGNNICVCIAFPFLWCSQQNLHIKRLIIFFLSFLKAERGKNLYLCFVYASLMHFYCSKKTCKQGHIAWENGLQNSRIKLNNGLTKLGLPNILQINY